MRCLPCRSRHRAQGEIICQDPLASEVLNSLFLTHRIQGLRLPLVTRRPVCRMQNHGSLRTDSTYLRKHPESADIPCLRQPDTLRRSKAQALGEDRCPPSQHASRELRAACVRAPCLLSSCGVRVVMCIGDAGHPDQGRIYESSNH